MSFFKKLGSNNRNKTGADAPALRVSDLSALESENASWDFSPEAQAKRDAEKAAAASLPDDDDDDDDGQDEDGAGAAAPVARKPKHKLAFRIPDGTNPAVTWPGEKVVDVMGEVTFTDQAAIREKFVYTPPVFSRFDSDSAPIKDLNIAPAHFLIDTLENPQALCAEMNTLAGAPTIDKLYDKDIVLTAPRFHCPWYKRNAIKRPSNDQLARTTLLFTLPLAASATVQDWHTYLAALPRSMQSALPLALAPGAIEKFAPLKYADGNVKDRKLHSIPVRVSIVEVHNTSPLRLEVELRVPNMKRAAGVERGEIFSSASDPIGVSSAGHAFASSATPKLNTVCALNSYAFNSPEAARWLTVDRELEEKNFTANLNGNKMYVNSADEEVVAIRLTPEPENLAQFIATSYPGHLITAALNEGVSRPVVNTHAVGKEEGNLYGHVAVPLKALLVVFRHFCDMYDPTQFAVNHHKWVLNASPSNKQGIGLHALRNLAVCDAQQGNVASAQLEYAIEVIHLPYEGPQRLSARDKAVLAEIDEEHRQLVDLSLRMAQVSLVQATSGPTGARATPQVASSAAEVAKLAPAYAAKAAGAYPPSRGQAKW